MKQQQLKRTKQKFFNQLLQIDWYISSAASEVPVPTL